MAGTNSKGLKVGRRTVLKLAAGAGLASATGLGIPSRARAADTTLAIWTGFPELQPFYEAVAKAYAAVHPEVKFTFFSTSLRETEQKLSAAVPTGTGPDIYDIGTNISVNFIEFGLIDPNPADVDQVLEVRSVEQVRGRLLHAERQDLRPAAHGGQQGLDVLQQGDVPGGRHRRTAGHHGRAGRGREEAGEVRQLRQDDAQRHQPAPLGPGQRHRPRSSAICSRAPAPR